MQLFQDLTIDVTAQVGLGGEARTAVTVFLPQPADIGDDPVVCFAFPGGGYCRQYFSFSMPDNLGHGQAGWHSERGWIFVACDSLGFGESIVPGGDVANYETVAAGNHATVAAVTQLLETGEVIRGYPPLRNLTLLGIGQSMGGCFTIVQQAHHQTFHGIGILGSSAIHTVVPSRPGTTPAAWPWIFRGSPLDNPEILNQSALQKASGVTIGQESLTGLTTNPLEHPLAWSFHYDDEPPEIVTADMAAASGLLSASDLPEWRSPTTPSCAIYMVAPGTVATEAASITVPVFVGTGERDVVPNPWQEPLAYKSAQDITVFVCSRMAHMHNFSTARKQFWERLHSWGNGVGRLRALESTTGMTSANV